MKLSDGTILMHGLTPYDPVKAHEYYMRTRQLTGRKKAAATYAVKLPTDKTVQLSEKKMVEPRAYIAKRVGEIKNRLTELNLKLVKMKSEAKRKKDADRRVGLATKAKPASRKESTKESKKIDPVAEFEQQIYQIKGRLVAVVARQRALATASRNS